MWDPWHPYGDSLTVFFTYVFKRQKLLSWLNHPTFYLEDSSPSSQTSLFTLYPVARYDSLFKIHLNIVLSSTLWCPKWSCDSWFSIPPKFLYGYLISHLCPMTLLHFNTACDVKIVMFLVKRRLQNETPFNNCVYSSVQYSPVHRQK